MQRILLFLGVLSLLCACRTVPPANTVSQFSTIDALLAGAYDGRFPLSQLKEQGNLGIGTFDSLDGEMILLNGVMFQVRADGKVYFPSDETTAPYAAIVAFDVDMTETFGQPVNFQDLCRKLDEKIADPNTFVALRASGRFQSVKTRSVPRQEKPFRPLVEVTRTQPEFSLDACNGTLVGFRCPTWSKGIGVAGWHLHFLRDDYRAGGHVLDFTLAEGTVQLDRCNRFALQLPAAPQALAGLDLSKDRSKELHEAESDRK